MWSLSLLVCGLFTADVEWSTLDGSTGRGTVLSVSEAGATFRTTAGEVSVPSDQLMEIRSLQSSTPPKAPQCVVFLNDDSQIFGQHVDSTQGQLTVRETAVGDVAIPMLHIRAIRFLLDTRFDGDWKEQTAREFRQDQLLILKKEVIDRIEGVVGDIGTNSVSFTLDGEPVPVKRERLLGVIFPRRSPSGRNAVSLTTIDGSTWSFQSLIWSDGNWSGDGLSGNRRLVKETVVRSVNWGNSRLRYLSDIEPRDVRYTACPLLGESFPFERDSDLEKRPLRLGGKVYPKGLAIHSKTVLKYRLGREFRSFQSTVGIDDAIRAIGSVRLTIKGDGRELYAGDFLARERPQTLNLSLVEIDELELHIDFGEDGFGVSDRLHLADAKLIR